MPREGCIDGGGVSGRNGWFARWYWRLDMSCTMEAFRKSREWEDREGEKTGGKKGERGKARENDFQFFGYGRFMFL